MPDWSSRRCNAMLTAANTAAVWDCCALFLSLLLAPQTGDVMFNIQSLIGVASLRM
jgi:hypothetical protein